MSDSPFTPERLAERRCTPCRGTGKVVDPALPLGLPFLMATIFNAEWPRQPVQVECPDCATHKPDEASGPVAPGR